MIASFDTNVLTYAFTTDPKAAQARLVMKERGAIGAQSLNEFANVARRKLKMDWTELHQALAYVRGLATLIVPLDADLHRIGLSISERYRLGIFDSTIVAAALRAESDILWSEDMQNGLVVEGRLTIRNPFIQA